MYYNVEPLLLAPLLDPYRGSVPVSAVRKITRKLSQVHCGPDIQNRLLSIGSSKVTRYMVHISHNICSKITVIKYLRTNPELNIALDFIQLRLLSL